MTQCTPERPARHRRGIRALTAAALAAPVLLTGCAAGQRAQTANEFSVVDGASTDVGQIALRNAGVSAPTTPTGYAKGESARLSLTLVNNGPGSDTLLSVSTPNAASATVASATAKSLVIPANGAVVVGSATGDAAVTLTNLTYRLVPAQVIPVTLKFQNAGAVTMQLPVKLVAEQTGGATIDVAPTTDAPS